MKITIEHDPTREKIYYVLEITRLEMTAYNEEGLKSKIVETFLKAFSTQAKREPYIKPRGLAGTKRRVDV